MSKKKSEEVEIPEMEAAEEEVVEETAEEEVVEEEPAMVQIPHVVRVNGQPIEVAEIFEDYEDGKLMGVSFTSPAGVTFTGKCIENGVLIS